MNETNLRPKEVAFRLGVARSTLYHWVSNHQFPRQRKIGFGRAVGWRASVIDDWIKASASGDFARMRELCRESRTIKD